MQQERLLRDIRKSEGYRQMPYRDSLGKWTCGTGHLLSPEDAAVMDRLTDKETHETQLMQDIANAIKIATDFAGDKWDVLTEAQEEVLTEMAFQLGNRLHQFKNMRAAMLDDDRDKMFAEMTNSLWARQTPARLKHAINKWSSDDGLT